MVKQIFVLGLLFTSSVFAQSNVLSLPQAVEQAVQQHPSIMANQSRVQKSESDTRIAQAAWYPQVNYRVGTNYEQGVNDTYPVELLLSQKVYDFGRTQATIAEKQSVVLFEEANLTQQQEVIALRTANAFLTVIGATRKVSVAENYLTQLADIHKRLLARVESGVGVRSDVSLLEIRVNSAKVGVKQAEQELTSAQSELQELLGYVPEKFEDPDQLFDSLRANLASKDELLAQALIQSPKIAAAQQELEAKRLSLTRSEKGFFPQIELQATSRLDNGYRKDDTGQYTLGLALTGNFYNGGETRAQIDAMEAEMRTSFYQLDTLRLATKTRIHTEYDNLLSTEDQLELVQLQVDAAQLAGMLYLQEYLVGGRSLVDVMSTENEKYQAELSSAELHVRKMQTLTTLIAESGFLHEFLQ